VLLMVVVIVVIKKEERGEGNILGLAGVLKGGTRCAPTPFMVCWHLCLLAFEEIVTLNVLDLNLSWKKGYMATCPVYVEIESLHVRGETTHITIDTSSRILDSSDWAPCCKNANLCPNETMLMQTNTAGAKRQSIANIPVFVFVSA
jgi:hypothetical protein